MSEKLIKGVIIIIPPAGERLYELRECFNNRGIDTYLYSYSADPDYKNTIDIVLHDLNNPLAVLIPEETFSFSDGWFLEVMKQKKGHIDCALEYFQAKGLKIIPIPLDWGGPFDDEVVCSCSNYDILINQVIEQFKK